VGFGVWGLPRGSRRRGIGRATLRICRVCAPGLGFRFYGYRLGFRVEGSGFKIWSSGFRVQGLGIRVQGLGFWVQVAGLKIWSSGFRDQGLGIRV